MNNVNEPKRRKVKQKTLTIILQGGLGNILFQLASAYGLSKEHKFIMNVNPYNFQHKSTDYPFLNNFKIVHTFLGTRVNEDGKKCTNYCNIFPKSCEHDVVLCGYFQNEKYFKKYRTDILELFKSPEIETMINELKNKYHSLSEAYFVHLRRGDYVNSNLHNINADKSIIKVIKNILKNDDCVFYIFSDDVEYYMKENIFDFIDKDKIMFINEQNELKCIYLMSLCYKGGICSNSTFGWWGGYLNTNPNKTLFFPNKWFNNDWKIDIYPERCILYDCVSS